MSSKALRKVISCQGGIFWGSEGLNFWSNLKEGNVPGIIYLILKKRTSEKIKCEFDFALQIFQTFSLFKYL